MTTLTPQQVLRRVGHHLLRQQAVSTIYNYQYDVKAPAYSGDYGRFSPIGYLLEDHEYDRNFELIEPEDVPLPARLEPHRELLCHLEWIHRGTGIATWRRRLKELDNPETLARYYESREEST